MHAGDWTAADIPDLAGRTAVVTGANTGLGLETARALAGHGAAVVLAVRDVDKGAAAAADVEATVAGAAVAVQRLDLASLASIRTAAAELRAATDRIDLVVNNAGVMYTPRSTTADGFELQFGVNYLGHFAFTGLLLDRLLSVPHSRVVTVSSLAHHACWHIDLDDLYASHWYDGYLAYARSKLAGLLFTYELQRRLDGCGARTEALAAHPGWSTTEIGRNSPAVLRIGMVVGQPFGQRAADGALPILRAATDPDAAGGDYYGPGGVGELRGAPRVVRSSPRSRDRTLARRLWDVSEELTGVTFPV